MKRNTMQRMLVLNAVKNYNTHLTADEIYENIKEIYPNISKGTVYRNLNELVSDNLVSKVIIDGSADRFEYISEPHYHLRCNKCGGVFDVKIPYMKDLDIQASQLTGFTLYSHNTTFTGICDKCKSN